jgi:hypothetical protein
MDVVQKEEWMTEQVHGKMNLLVSNPKTLYNKATDYFPRAWLVFLFMGKGAEAQHDLGLHRHVVFNPAPVGEEITRRLQTDDDNVMSKRSRRSKRQLQQALANSTRPTSEVTTASVVATTSVEGSVMTEQSQKFAHEIIMGKVEFVDAPSKSASARE